MDKLQQVDMAAKFLARHRAAPILLLPNAWDVLSAKLFIAAGFDALATTSAGVAWALGYPDGESAPWAEVVASTARIIEMTDAPVTADIEAGYGKNPAEVGAHVAEIIRAGVVGINLEDGWHGTVRSIDDAVGRLRAARAAARHEGVPIVINARCDIFHVANGNEEMRLASTVERCKAYLEAGADCVYPFGLRDAATISELVKMVDAPINITGRPGMPNAAAFEQIGVARITLASAPALVAMSVVRKLAVDVLSTGDFSGLAAEFRHPDAQRLFRSRG